MIVPFYAVMVGRVGGDILDAGFAASIFAVVAGFVFLATGRLIDKAKRKEHIIAISNLLMRIGYVLYCFTDTVWSVWEANNYFAGAVGALMGSLIIKYAPFETLFILMSLLCLLSATGIFRLKSNIFSKLPKRIAG
ncbi:MAG TPA: hypothetical protein PLT04_00990 [Candidatus Saccharibacteria bacterium]|nr:hypothetical protein [Candidatus Saccharibacteria bacterium]